MDFFLLPYPRKAKFQSVRVNSASAQWIKSSPEFSAVLQRAVIRWLESVGGFFPGRLEMTLGEPGDGAILLTLEPVNRKLREQQYRLTAANGQMTLEGGSEAAVFYGLQTLAQLLPQTGAFLPDFVVDDAPDFANRGYMLDVSRCKVPTMATLYRLIDMMARLKFNQLQLYMEHTFAFAAHERVWADASPFTAQQIVEIDQYCRDRFIQLVPNLNSFGHLERWLKLDEYKYLAECPAGFESPWGHRAGGVLKPNADSLKFLDSLYAEFLPNFSSRFFNIGCDETWELGQGWSKKLCAKKGKTRVYLDFLLQVAKLADRYDRSVMFWGDIILHQPELIKELPKDITAMNWGYEAGHPFAKETAQFAEAGVPFYVCPGTSSWNSLSGRTANCLTNLVNAAENGKKNGALGYLITDWGDGGHHQYPPVAWPGLTAGAAYSWNLAANRDRDIPAAVDLLWAHDRAGVIGEYLADFGRIPDHFAHPGCNNTQYGRALCAPLSPAPAWLKEVTVPEIRAALKTTLALRDRLAAALPSDDDALLLLDELRNGSFMVEAALNKLLLMKGKAVDLPELIDLFRRIIGNHQRLWLARNRSGGLNESSGHLRKALDELVEYARKQR